MRSRSSSSAGAIYLDREARERAIEAIALRAYERLPEIRRIILFGSMVWGTPTPRSDADLLVEVTTASSPHPADRAELVLREIGPTTFPLEIIVYTSDELETMMEEKVPLVVAALARGRVLPRPENAPQSAAQISPLADG